MQNMIQARNVRRCFRVSGNDFWALKGVDMDVPAGALTILRGRSGSGKTTLMNILGALDAPTEGSVLFDGQDIVALDDHARTKLRRERIGFVFQSVALIPMMTALENVEYALRLARYKGDRRERALECLRLVGLSARQKHMPQELSGGEQQRIAIAIALANSPKLLLADEPTGSVDVKTGAYILDMFRDINRSTGLTIVIVTHDRLLAKKVNRVVTIRDGKISSERILKQSYLDRLHDITSFTDVKQVQDEYAILDRAGRVQLPRELLDQLELTGNKVRLELVDGRIVIEKPEAAEGAE